MTLPSGTVTFLFTDIEGSTKLAQEHPDEMPALLARHHEILHQAIQAHNGFVFQIIGDAFCASFHSASDALHAALDAQRLLQNEAWTPAPIKVRMGIHTGAAQLNDDEEYSGYTTLASTQRIMSAGHGGQILISGATRELVRDSLPEKTEFIDLGEKRLKDLMRPERLYQLNITGLPTIFPPLKTLDSFPNNLPTQLTSFIGRENEITELKQELDAYRLVTLTGSGGTGKTRLSLQVAAELLEKFDHGVWFVELAPLSDPELIPQTILSAIGIKEQPGKPPLELLKEYLHEKRTLLLLDNCEHLISASAQVVNALLNTAPKLKVLASSREALGVKGEASYPVLSLSVPDIKQMPVVEQLSKYEAVRLFIDRALLVAPHFVLDKDNASFIAQICHRLDGIPLAIELAAARVKVLSVEQISKRLDDRFRLLVGGARTALPRQQTLRALIDWSYDLLPEPERLLLCRLSVFVGGWTLEAAEEVCSDGAKRSVNSDQTDHQLLITDILDLLTQLVNKSLVVVVEHSRSGETRYRMLETIRQYAREKLLDAGGGEAIRDKHLEYFVKLTEQAEPELYRSNQLFWFNRLEDEFDNLRMALGWTLDTNVESGLRIASIPWRFWYVHGYSQELGKWLEQLLERYDKTDVFHAQALAVYSLCVFRQGNFPETIRLGKKSVQMARTISDRRLEAFGLSLQGVYTLLQGNVSEGAPLLEQSLDIFRKMGNKIGQANTLEWLSFDNSNLERSIAYAKESLSLYRELGDLNGMANALIVLARLALWSGDFSSPVQWLEEALSISHQLGDLPTRSTALSTMGILSFWQGDYQTAIVRYEESNLQNEKVGYQYGSLWNHVRMAHVFLRQGEVQRARLQFTDCIEKANKANFMIVVVYAIEGLASLNITQKKYKLANQLYAWTDAMREKIGDQRPPVERDFVAGEFAIINSKVDNNEIADITEKARTMTTEQAIALTLEE